MHAIPLSWRRLLRNFLAIAVLCGSAQAYAAELKVAAIFADHMVLQREKPVAIWGWANAGETVQVTFGNQKKEAVASSDGRWSTKLDPMPANSTPSTLTVRGATEDRSKSIRDVLVGEVWLGSGQSNMAMTVARSLDFEKEQKAADQPLIRMFKEESVAARTVQSDAKGNWTVCSPNTVGNYSATLFFFGRELHRELGVPIGLINSSVGGTPIESWIAEDSQKAVASLKSHVENQSRADAKFDEAQARARYEKAIAKWREDAMQAKREGRPAPTKPTDPIEQRKRKGGVGGLFNAKIAPLVPYTLRGILWYQGEANANPGGAPLYQTQLELLVTDWRKLWGEDVPFAWVQLPNFDRPGEGWMLVREAMFAATRLPKTGMAITIDIGETKDIHPRNKQDVGKRLSLWALSQVYGRNIELYTGPIAKSMRVSGATIRVDFEHGKGLKPLGEKLVGFEIAGKDKNWKPADAKIEGESIVVSNADIQSPTAIRYAWEPNPVATLVNGANLPASPFRLGAN